MAVAAIRFVALYACKKETERNDYKILNQSQNINKQEEGGDSRRVILYLNFEECGRTSQNCAGFGLCNFVMCTNCCLDPNDNIVDCPTQSQIPNAGKLNINEGESQGFLIINLDSIYINQRDAIINQEILYVDEDLQGDNFTIQAGQYQYRTDIGLQGGYLVNVIRR